MNVVDFKMEKLLKIQRLLACLTLFVEIMTRYLPPHVLLCYDVCFTMYGSDVHEFNTAPCYQTGLYFMLTLSWEESSNPAVNMFIVTHCPQNIRLFIFKSLQIARFT